ncbi:MAG: hypothetical protein R3E79_59205 [Caldilineaceae bacterium]
MPAYRWEGRPTLFLYDLSTMVLMYNKNLFEAGMLYSGGRLDVDQFLGYRLKLAKDTDGDGKTDQCGAGCCPIFRLHYMDVPLTTNKASMYNADGDQVNSRTP